MADKKKPANRIISLRKAVRLFIQTHQLEESTVDELLAALDLAALDYLESR
jgi:hypothetical protein